jgi:hypothetical protein
VARLLDLDDAVSVPEDRRARHLAQAVRKPLLERVSLSQDFFAALMAAAVHESGQPCPTVGIACSQYSWVGLTSAYRQTGVWLGSPSSGDPPWSVGRWHSQPHPGANNRPLLYGSG